jgi:hypothetical protein
MIDDPRDWGLCEGTTDVMLWLRHRAVNVRSTQEGQHILTTCSRRRRPLLQAGLVYGAAAVSGRGEARL